MKNFEVIFPEEFARAPATETTITMPERHPNYHEGSEAETYLVAAAIGIVAVSLATLNAKRNRS